MASYLRPLNEMIPLDLSVLPPDCNTFQLGGTIFKNSHVLGFSISCIEESTVMVAGEHSRKSFCVVLRGNGPCQACCWRCLGPQVRWLCAGRLCSEVSPGSLVGRVSGSLCSWIHSPLLRSCLGAGDLRSPQDGFVLRPAPPLVHGAPSVTAQHKVARCGL